jgi:hypothetical protein
MPIPLGKRIVIAPPLDVAATTGISVNGDAGVIACPSRRRHQTNAA